MILRALRHHPLWRLILIHLLLILLLLLHLHQLLVHVKNRVNLRLYLTLVAPTDHVWLCLLHPRRSLLELAALKGCTKLSLIRVLTDHVSIGLRHAGQLWCTASVKQPKVVLTLVVHALDELLARCVHL